MHSPEQAGITASEETSECGLAMTEMEEKNCKHRMKELVQRIVRADMPIAVTKDIGHGTDAKAIIIGKEYRF